MASQRRDDFDRNDSQDSIPDFNADRSKSFNYRKEFSLTTYKPPKDRFGNEMCDGYPMLKDP
jgi:hypothetical protein